MPKYHARLAPSAAARWINCPGSVALSESLPEPPGSEYASEGTHAHMVAEFKLQRATAGLSTRQFNKAMKNAQDSPYWSKVMDDATDFYVDHVLEALTAAGWPNADLCIEQRVDFSRWVPEGFGTSDSIIVTDGLMEVIDFKYGQGVRVQAKNNPQLRLYALGAYSLFSSLYDMDRIRMTIIQPRLDHVDTDEISAKELLIWAAEEVAPRARMAVEGTDYTASGDWCRWCPAKAVCRTRAEKNLELAKMDFKAPPLLTNEEIGAVLAQAEHLQKWAADVQDYALQQAKAGEHFTGWKLVEGRAVRKYADDLKVAEALQAAGYDEAVLYERKLLGISAMEKLVGRKKLTETLGDLIIRPAGKPVLVPESDKRPEINATASAKADFDDEGLLPFN